MATPSSSSSANSSRRESIYHTPSRNLQQPAVETTTATNEGVPQGLLSSSPSQMLLIDKLRDLGVGAVVALPQLVVVGDQSSGKSSVLEAIMEFPFPRDSEVCTRFATNIVFRRAATTSVSVDIVPELISFKRDTFESIDGPTFGEIIKKASQAMGISGANGVRSVFHRAFSDSVLKIEISGPDRENLSIIDIPGIFRNTRNGETTEADIALVNQMVRSYIKDERTIILAVVPANVDIATQEILNMAKEADPKGQRTLAVLTKPDIVDKGAERNVIDLVEGRKDQLSLGYCIVRNRGQNELASTSAERGANELAFFNTRPWNDLPKERVGIKSLKSRLQQLLSEIISREFPVIKRQIDTNLKEFQSSLQALGPERDSAEQQRRFLEGISTKFQSIKNDAMDKMYHRHAALMAGTTMRLPTRVAQACDAFTKEFRDNGITVDFDDIDEVDSEDEYADDGTTDHEDGNSDDETNSQEDAPSLGDFRDLSEYPELESLNDSPEWLKEIEFAQEFDAAMDARSWIQKEYRAARGYELGVTDTSILPLLWRTQSSSWESISARFLNTVVSLVHVFMGGLLDQVCPDERTKTSLFSFLMDDILAKYTKANDAVRHILNVERSGKPITRNQDFNKTLSELRTRRTEATGAQEVGTSKSRVTQAVDDLHAILMVYHKIARKRVVDNIIQNVDYYLLSGEQSPLNILTPVFISSMTSEELDKVAGESMLSRTNRKQLKRQIAMFEEGRSALRGH